MKLKNLDGVWDIRAAEFDLVVTELVLGRGASKIRMTFGISAKDALKLGRGFVAAGKSASSWARAGTSRRIAAQLLSKAARR